ncbi:MAG: class 3 adenylate cyclase [Granulosicoccus sp.]|jgi:class 3 adenylate cyclase
MSAEALVEMIDEYFSAFDRVIETYGLEKVKTIGDSYMAAGGIPEPTNEHAAIEMQMHGAALMKKKKKLGLPYCETRIGVHTGPVVAGVVGIKKFAYDIWGDTVNTAARLEKAGEVGQVNISEPTYNLVKDRFNCTHRGKIPIKNMGEIDMYFVG